MMGGKNGLAMSGTMTPNPLGCARGRLVIGCSYPSEAASASTSSRVRGATFPGSVKLRETVDSESPRRAAICASVTAASSFRTVTGVSVVTAGRGDGGGA